MKKKQDISSLHTYAVFISLFSPFLICVSQLLPSLLAGSLYTHNMCALFDYAGYATVRAPVERKKKQDISSLHTYAGYAAARAPVEPKKKQDISFFHTYAVFLS
jgi:hypothetical protein